MNRRYTNAEYKEIVDRIRRNFDNSSITTDVMVGFPGETDKDFEELMDFVKWAKFDRLGAFAYSEEEGTYAGDNYRDNVSKKKKQERLDRLMEVQQRISTRLNDAKVGNVYKTIIDRVEGDYYIGRTEFDSPDVDTEVLINVAEGELKIGCFYDVRITDATEFDLMGTLEKGEK